MHLIAYILLGLFLKYSLLFIIFIILKNYIHHYLSAFLYSYIIVDLLIYLILLLLSIGNNLTKINLITSLIIFFLLLLTYLIFLNHRGSFNFRNLQSILPSIIEFICNWGNILAITIFLLLFFRSLYFYDATDDGLAYELPRLSLFAQNHSLFTFYHTQTINIFSNEWLGELNALYYLIISNIDQSTSFGNAENWLLVYLIFYWSLDIYGYTANNKSIYAIFLCTFPIVLGLAMTNKTDLIAIGTMVFTTACLYRYYKKNDKYSFLIAIISLGLIAGSKISLVPTAGLLFICILYNEIVIDKKFFTKLLIGLLTYGISCSRYIINLVQYGNPFQRALSEKLFFSINSLIENAHNLIISPFEIINIIHNIGSPPNIWILNKKFGYGWPIFIFFLLLIVIFGIRYQTKYKTITNMLHSKQIKYILFPIMLSSIIFMTSTQWYDWSFRYYVPWLLAIFTPILSFMLAFYKKYSLFNNKIPIVIFISIFTLITIILNLTFSFRIREAVPSNITTAINANQLQRKLAFQNYHYDELKKIPNLLNILKAPGNILILDTFASPIYQFMGDNHCLKTDLVSSDNELLNIYNKKNYNLIIIATLNYDSIKYQDIEKQLFTENYSEYITSFGAIFIPRST